MCIRDSLHIVQHLHNRQPFPISPFSDFEDRGFAEGAIIRFCPIYHHICNMQRTLQASLQSTGAQSTGSQEQVQHQNAKSTQYRDLQLPYCTQREQQSDQRLLYISPNRGTSARGDT